MDLSHAARAADAHTEIVRSVDELDGALHEAMAAARDGPSAVLDIRIEPITGD